MTVPNQANPNDSAHPGWMQASEPAGDGFVISSDVPAQIAPGNDLEDYLQQWTAGVSGLDGTLVRARWQREPPNLPDFSVTWCGAGVIRRRPLGAYSATIRHPEGDGYDEMQRHEEFEWACSFYGPNADVVASNFHDGVQTFWNWAPLRLVGLAFVECRESVRAPEFIRQQWLDRVDKVIVLRRIIRRHYPVLNLLEAEGWVITDTATGYQTQFQAGPAPYVTPSPK